MGITTLGGPHRNCTNVSHPSSRRWPSLRERSAGLRIPKSLEPEGAGLTSVASGLRMLCRDGPPNNFGEGGLVGGFDDEFVNIHVLGTRGNPNQNFGDVFGDERTSAFVGFFGAFDIAFETHDREFGFGEPGVHGANAQPGAIEFEAQRAGDLEFGRLRAAISRAAFVNPT